MQISQNTVHYCSHCGERTNGKFCKLCSTKDARAEIDRLNEEIRQENIARGVASPDFAYPCTRQCIIQKN